MGRIGGHMESEQSSRECEWNCNRRPTSNQPSVSRASLYTVPSYAARAPRATRYGMGLTGTLAASACTTRKHAEWSSSRVSTLPHLDLSRRFDTNVTEKVPAARKCSQGVKPTIVTKAKPMVTVPNPKLTRQLRLVRSQPIVDQSPSPMPLPKVSKTWENDAGMSMPDKGKAAARVKRRLAEDATDSMAKRARVDVHRPDLEVADNLAG